MHVDVHAETVPPKRRRLSRAATESNDVPELREAADAAMHRQGYLGSLTSDLLCVTLTTYSTLCRHPPALSPARVPGGTH